MPSLRSQAVSGVKWISTSPDIITVLQYVRVAILTHMLAPIALETPDSRRKEGT